MICTRCKKEAMRLIAPPDMCLTCMSKIVAENSSGDAMSAVLSVLKFFADREYKIVRVSNLTDREIETGLERCAADMDRITTTLAATSYLTVGETLGKIITTLKADLLEVLTEQMRLLAARRERREG